MAPLVLLNNFKFKYFFGVQIPTKNLICPIASLVSCNVLESNNIDKQKKFPFALELQSSSLEIFVMLEIIVISVDDEYVPFPKKPKKVVADVNCKFQKIWAMKMPWEKPIFNDGGLVCIVKCCVCTKIEMKEKNLVINWDSIKKHVGKRKGFDGKWIMDPKCTDIKNEITYAQLSTTIVFQQLNSGHAVEDK
jgi:hypothetical protein